MLDEFLCDIDIFWLLLLLFVCNIGAQRWAFGKGSISDTHALPQRKKFSSSQAPAGEKITFIISKREAEREDEGKFHSAAAWNRSARISRTRQKRAHVQLKFNLQISDTIFFVHVFLPALLSWLSELSKFIGGGGGFSSLSSQPS